MFLSYDDGLSIKSGELLPKKNECSAKMLVYRIKERIRLKGSNNNHCKCDLNQTLYFNNLCMYVVKEGQYCRRRKRSKCV
jgi:hypothetical protein